MVRPAQTARSERTREALRRAALLRFLDQGVEETSAEQIAADAGVSLRTFYRHFASKHDLLFADYDAGLHWFRSALASRPADEPLIESVQAAIFAFPYDVDVVAQIASLRASELEPDRIVRHIREVESDFSDAIAEHIRRRRPDGDPLQITVTARCIAAATFGAMELWMAADERSLADLARMCQTPVLLLIGHIPVQHIADRAEQHVGDCRALELVGTLSSILTKLSGGDSVHGRVVRRLPVRDRGLAATVDVGGRQPRTRPGRLAEALRGMLAFLAVNTTYRGPETPSTAAAFASGLAVPNENEVLTKKMRGGIGALTRHLLGLFTSDGGELRLRTSVAEILVRDGRVAGVRTKDGSTMSAPVVVSGVAPDLTVLRLVDASAVSSDVRERFSRVDHRGSYLQMHFALDGIPEFAAPYELLNDPAMQANIGLFSTPEELQQQWQDCRRGIVPADPAVALQIPSVHDPALAPDGKHAASAFSLWFPIENDGSEYGRMKTLMGQRVIDKLSRIAPNFERLITRHTTFTPKHMGTMFGAPGGDYCYGLLHPDQIGFNRPGPTGFRDQPIGIGGLYLGSAGCYGGPGITFIPGYNAAREALADVNA